jgi:protein tyrosine/serine phosphatase
MSEKRQTSRPLRQRIGLVVAAVVLLLGGTYVYLRYWRGNFHAVVPGKVYRSAQPSEQRLRDWINEYNIKTVINLRGESSHDFLVGERRVTDEMGVELINIRFSAVNLPTRRWLGELIEALETAEKPILLHCRDGADRSGVASVLAAMAVGNERLDEAWTELSWYYMHFDESPDHIAGLIQRFDAWRDQDPSREGNWEEFKHWAAEVYRPHYYHVVFDSPETLTLAPGQRKPVDLTIHNRSRETLPLGDESREFAVMAFLGTSIEDTPGKPFGPWKAVKGEHLPHGESLTIRYPIVAPRKPGVYEVRLDMVEKSETWFHRQGSPMGRIKLIVSPTAEAAADPAPEKEGEPAS